MPLAGFPSGEHGMTANRAAVATKRRNNDGAHAKEG